MRRLRARQDRRREKSIGNRVGRPPPCSLAYSTHLLHDNHTESPSVVKRPGQFWASAKCLDKTMRRHIAPNTFGRTFPRARQRLVTVSGPWVRGSVQCRIWIELGASALSAEVRVAIDSRHCAG